MSARDRNRTDANVVTLGPRDSLVGTLRIEGALNVLGSVEGEVSVSGDVTVESGATVQASIEARNITVRGQVSGDVVAQKKLLLSGSGTLQGDARVGRLVVEDGASFNGSITMGTTPVADNDESTEWTDETTTTDEPAGEVEMVGAAEGYTG